MFTGIIEELGSVSGWQQGSQACQLTIGCEQALETTEVGHSIAVNGVCLTVAHMDSKSFTADILVESLRKTALQQLRVGDPVNLERALQVGSRLGGHWVTGHIDDVGRIVEVRRERNSLWYSVDIPRSLLPFLVHKGSIAIDGTSLTIARLDGCRCTVSLIPHTASHTVLGSKQVGDVVNIETDILGKYAAKLLRSSSSDDTLHQTLQDAGFI